MYPKAAKGTLPDWLRFRGIPYRRLYDPETHAPFTNVCVYGP